MTAAITTIGALEARSGVLERGGVFHLVEFLHWFDERVGHLRELVELRRWRWVVYEPGGDAVGDEAERVHALNVARLYLLRNRPPPAELRPPRLSPADRAERAREAAAWALATGAKRERLKAAYERRWCP